ncbi:MAG: UDP-N-acetylmuramate dehydrogenase [Eubacteriales bacterium]|nr:UDP-N-acetylmuramate dehydrogenase [Eubacteriales bacterium]
MTRDDRAAWQALCQDRFQADVPLSRYTTIRTGGPAKWLLDARDEGEIVHSLSLARRLGIPALVMGCGSNLLISDQGFDGLVVRLGPGFNRMSAAGECVRAQAGATLKAVACFAADRNLAGLSFAAGIPGSLGGACYMNAGAFGGEMAQVISFLDCLDPDGRRLTVSVGQAEYGYRQSRMMEEGLIVLGAELRLAPGHKEELYRQMREYQACRLEKQPLTYPSAGSFFKRPAGLFAGKLIEEAGLKGLTIGQAQVSEKHAGFLINLGGATTEDFLKLKGEVQRRVMAASGVLLEPEVRIIPSEAEA